MYILNATKTYIHNSKFIQRVTISPKEDAWLVCAALSTREPLLTLGRYFSEEKAAEVLQALFAALSGGAAYFEMPLHSDIEESAKTGRPAEAPGWELRRKTMPDYIERDAAKAAFCREMGYTSPRAALAADVIFNAIPAANVRTAVRAEWVADPYDPEYMTVDFHCSHCGIVLEEYCIDGDCWPGKTSHYFCPNCGADMRPETTAENAPIIFTNGQIVDVNLNLYDQEEIHDNCTVQILRNSYTGVVSVGWWDNDAAPKGVDHE